MIYERRIRGGPLFRSENLGFALFARDLEWGKQCRSVTNLKTLIVSHRRRCLALEYARRCAKPPGGLNHSRSPHKSAGRTFFELPQQSAAQ